MFRWPWAILSRFGVVAFAGYVGWQAWENFGPRLPDIGPLRQKVADGVIDNVVRAIKDRRENLYSAALIPLVNDPSGYVTDRLRQRIEQSGVLALKDRTLIEKVEKALKLQPNAQDSFENAVVVGRRMGVQAVVFGKVRTHEAGDGAAQIVVEVQLADVANQREVFPEGDRVFSHKLGGVLAVPTAVRDSAHRVGWGSRLLGWGLLVLMLPIFSVGFIRAMVRRESNTANAFALSLYTAVDLILAWLFLGALFAAWWGVVIFLVLVALAFGYNVAVMSRVVQIES